eukprot:2397095-Rhodomonas_salina.1
MVGEHHEAGARTQTRPATSSHTTWRSAGRTAHGGTWARLGLCPTHVGASAQHAGVGCVLSTRPEPRTQLGAPRHGRASVICCRERAARGGGWRWPCGARPRSSRRRRRGREGRPWR